ncbi:DUF4189 domain-containing protein [Indioceanicola profundi]|uniref:DUF4189 domain-containing protein n=1 Tax=Indioceanicola profundi TaxID=2220096 RepID=UPI000E6ACA27|nr:hypothetical protein [Indioceanicola profundi]
MRKQILLLTSLAALAAAPAMAQDQPEAIANLSSQGRDAFTVYSQFSNPKAFAVASDGAYGFYGGQGSADQAMSEAVRRCQSVSNTGDCQVVSMNDEPMVAAGPGVAEALRSMNTSTMGGLREEAVQDFRQAQSPKALATSQDGAWGWVAGASSIEAARSEALRHCSEWGQGCEVTEAQ